MEKCISSVASYTRRCMECVRALSHVEDAAALSALPRRFRFRFRFRLPRPLHPVHVAAVHVPATIAIIVIIIIIIVIVVVVVVNDDNLRTVVGTVLAEALCATTPALGAFAAVSSLRSSLLLLCRLIIVVLNAYNTAALGGIAYAPFRRPGSGLARRHALVPPRCAARAEHAPAQTMTALCRRHARVAP